MMNRQPSTAGLRWSALSAEGCKVKLLTSGGGYWTVFECESELIAEHIVRELKAWSKGQREAAEVTKLCRAGD